MGLSGASYLLREGLPTEPALETVAAHILSRLFHFVASSYLVVHPPALKPRRGIFVAKAASGPTQPWTEKFLVRLRIDDDER